MGILMCATGCFTKVPPEQRPGTIAGDVTDSTTGLPIFDACVLIVGTRYGAMTADNGSFQIRRLEPVSYTLRASCVGYKTIERTVTVEPQETTRVAITLAERDRPIGEVLPIPPELLPSYGHLKGRVVDSLTGEPLLGALVSVVGEKLGAYTEPGGYYQILKMDTGRHAIRVEGSMYFPDEADSVSILPGETSVLNVRLQHAIGPPYVRYSPIKGFPMPRGQH